jgi:winged helix DNA-binding protein
MRPTWHFVAADDIRWLLQLTASRVNIKSGPNYRKLELDDRTFKKCNKAIVSALKRGKHLTRAALRKFLNDVGVAAQDPVRLAHILLRAELDGVVCSGPMVGRQFTYALLDERVTGEKTLTRDEALAKLTRRYFTSHGPATLRDFTWWSGLTMLDAKNGIALVERHLSKVSCDGEVYWATQFVETLQRPARAAYLLPAFDEYTVAYKDRTAIFDLNYRKPADLNRAQEVLVMHQKAGSREVRPNGILGPTVIVDGKIVGSWKHTRVDGYSFREGKDNKTMTITVKPFRPLRKLEKLAIKMAVDRYTRFWGLSPSVNNSARIE